jgi:hypothetical protein
MSDFDSRKLKKRERGIELNESNSKKNLLWLILFLVIVIGVVVFFSLNKCGGERKEVIDNLRDTSVVESKNKVDSLHSQSEDTGCISMQNSQNSSSQIEESIDEPKGDIIVSSKDVKDTNDIKVTVNTDVFLLAKRVIRGDFGNGNDRRVALGEEYQIIQHQVNLNYRSGDLYW